VQQLKKDLDQAEQSIAQLKELFQQVDTDALIDELVASASRQISISLKKVLQDSDIVTPITQMSAELSAAQEAFEKTNQAIVGIHETVRGLDNEEISKLISFYILKDLGDGSQKAAENNKPNSMLD
jgi:hypothetical protein